MPFPPKSFARKKPKNTGLEFHLGVSFSDEVKTLAAQGVTP
jgi:hypothetical protein